MTRIATGRGLPDWIRGIASVENGSSIVTFQNANLIADDPATGAPVYVAGRGDIFTIDGVSYGVISQVDEPNQITLVTPWEGETLEGVEYAIIRMSFPASGSVAKAVQDLLDMASGIDDSINREYLVLDDGTARMRLGMLNGVPSIMVGPADAGEVELKARLRIPRAGVSPETVFELPSNNGNPNDVLTTDGSGKASWGAVDLSKATLPVPTQARLGGVYSATAATHTFMTGIDAAGRPVYARPAAVDIAGLAASATIDATNAANITFGTLASERLPAPTTTKIGGVKSGYAPADKFVTGIDATGSLVYTSIDEISIINLPMPALDKLGGVYSSAAPARQFATGLTTDGVLTYRGISGADLPLPAATTLGGVKSGIAPTNQYVTGIDGAGALTFSAFGTGLPTIAPAHIWVGNTTSEATSVAVYGDASMDDTGKLTVTKTGGVMFGAAATMNVGTGAGTLASGNDSRIVNALQKGNNLSDVLDKAAARTSLGLSSAATIDTTNANNITSGVLSTARGGTGTGTTIAAGALIFSGLTGAYTGSASNVFWDIANGRLGVGTGAPAYLVEARADAATGISYIGAKNTTAGAGYGAGFIASAGAGGATSSFTALGDGSLQIATSAAAPIKILSGGAERLRIDAAGAVTIGGAVTTGALSASSLALTAALPVTSGGTGVTTATGTGSVVLSASPALTGVPTAPTAAVGVNTTQIATTAFVQAATNAMINGAPGALDTLQELAAAMGNDPNFAATVTNGLAGKLEISKNLSDLANPATARVSLGLGALATISTINNSNWLGSVLTVANGGTGASDAATARTNLGLGSVATESVVPVTKGGTGLTSLTAGYIPYGNGTGAFGNDSGLFWDNTNKRLGVGTAAPAFTIEARKDSATATHYIGVKNASAGNAFGAGFIASAGATGNTAAFTALGDGTLQIGPSLATAATRFFAGSTERFTILGSGNVGVGVANPTSLLHVGGAIAAGSLSLTTALPVASGGTGVTTATGTGSVVLSASPALTGVPTAPTAAVGVNTTQIATTAFVAAVINTIADAVATGGGLDRIFYNNDQIITQSYTIPSGVNSHSTGPLAAVDGVVVAGSDGVVWAIA